MKIWIGLAISSTALCFQTLVLHEWHHRLSDEFKDIKGIVLERLKEQEKRLEELKQKSVSA